MNKIAAAILVAGISVMVVSKVGNILVAKENVSAAHGDGGSSGHSGTGTKPPVKKEDPTIAVVLASADAKKGKSVSSKCKSCHTMTKGGRNGQGPNLWNIINRKKGSVAGFKYSSAMKSAAGNWTYADIYKFLKKPQGLVKGTRMSFRLKSVKQRGQIIAYLRTLSESPVALPKPEKKAPEKKTEAPKKEAPKKAEPAKAVPGKPDPKKAEPKKAEPKKMEAKKTEPAKPTPKKEMAPKKAEAAKPEMKKPEAMKPKTEPKKAMPEKKEMPKKEDGMKEEKKNP